MSTWALTTPNDFLRRCFAFAVVGDAEPPFSITCDMMTAGQRHRMGCPHHAPHSQKGGSPSCASRVLTGGSVAQGLNPCPCSCSASTC